MLGGRDGSGCPKTTPRGRYGRPPCTMGSQARLGPRGQEGPGPAGPRGDGFCTPRPPWRHPIFSRFRARKAEKSAFPRGALNIAISSCSEGAAAPSIRANPPRQAWETTSDAGREGRAGAIIRSSQSRSSDSRCASALNCPRPAPVIPGLATPRPSRAVSALMYPRHPSVNPSPLNDSQRRRLRFRSWASPFSPTFASR